ncbi:hypothetical protein FSP39_004832 [Pinctada imbricata]|uniref:Thymidine phosphorylase n=1 Tax=Pinctada imbricata TaxID=66713 RepID=A0AA88Y3F7_PINIB|nr:hypothetical protein FSP39_004832 [Pinctada imbricata]
MDEFDKYRVPDLIAKKRDGQKLNKDEIEFFIKAAVNGKVQDSQLGAMLMAMYIRDLDDDETTDLTRSMMMSGEIMEWPNHWRGKLVDKHSTGGVGDKISLALAPALAACGMKVPMVSGRGLGHTGGTLDKLEAIPGFTVSRTTSEMIDTLETVGCCIVGQTKSLVPADKILYATRDVTSTVSNKGLIAGSIISKKAAENIDALVLDVKYGKGAMMQAEHDARELAKRMVAIGNGLGITTTALLTNMDAPIGRMVGNALEVAEAIFCLHGNGPSDLGELVTSLGGHLLHMIGKVSTLTEGCNKIRETLQNGTAMKCFERMLVEQGVNENVASQLCDIQNDVFDVLPKAKYVTPITTSRSGYVQEIDAMMCAVAAGKLGTGRTKSSDPINYAAGLELLVQIGDQVIEGQQWIKVHHDMDILPDEVGDLIKTALVIGPESIKAKTLSRVLDVIRGEST